MKKQRTVALPLATLAAAAALAAGLPTSASAAAAGFAVKPATSVACTVQIQQYTEPEGIVVDVLAVTNTGSALAGWTVTISTDTQIVLAAASQGTWSHPSPGEIVGSDSATLATGAIVHAAIDGPGLGGQPFVTLNGAVCASS